MSTHVSLNPGDTAPNFTLLDANASPVSLSDFAGRKVVLFFYPAAMTPGCTTEACEFRDSEASLMGLGYQVIGISKDSVAKQAEFRDAYQLTYPLLSDEDLSVQKAYGAFGEKNNYGKIVEGSIRSTFVIDEHGKIEHALYGVKATGHVARIRKLLGAD